MAKLDRIATHAGTVVRVTEGTVDVQIESTSACATCEAHSHCGFAESKNKTMAIPTTDWAKYTEGDAVNVHIDESRGLLAVWIAYVLPALLMLGIIVGLSLANAKEWMVAVSAIAVLAIYVLLLYFMKSRIGRTFTLNIEKC